MTVITGTGGSVTKTTTMVRLPSPLPHSTLALAAAPSTVSIARGGTAPRASLTVTPSGGFNSAVTSLGGRAGRPASLPISRAGQHRRAGSRNQHGDLLCFEHCDRRFGHGDDYRPPGRSDQKPRPSRLPSRLRRPAWADRHPSTVSVTRSGTAPVNMAVTTSGGFQFGCRFRQPDCRRV